MARLSRFWSVSDAGDWLSASFIPFVAVGLATDLTALPPPLSRSLTGVLFFFSRFFLRSLQLRRLATRFDLHFDFLARIRLTRTQYECFFYLPAFVRMVLQKLVVIHLIEPYLTYTNLT